MKKLTVLLAIIPVSVSVAFTYYIFEVLVRKSTDYVWNTVFHTNDTRWVLVPLCIVLTLVYFGVQHLLDPKSEHAESEGLGSMPKPTMVNLAKVLFIGFLSLLAGASLGPEAILVPSSLLLGAYIGKNLFDDKPDAVKLLTAAGFIALFTAFFHSYIIGILSILLVTKQAKIKLSPPLFLMAVIASVATYITLIIIEAPGYFRAPDFSWSIKSADFIWVPILLVAGAGITFGIKFCHWLFSKIKNAISEKPWWLKALAAAAGLSVLYLLGGQLVEFTGNESIQPMLQDAAKLGLLGLVWIGVVKIAAIGWSKTLGYRGGLVFPSLFVASVMVAIAQTINHDVSFSYGIIAVVFGLIAANKKAKILF